MKLKLFPSKCIRVNIKMLTSLFVNVSVNKTCVDTLSNFLAVK